MAVLGEEFEWVETRAAPRRGQITHSITVSAIEKHLEILRKALNTSNQCAIDLEKVLFDTRTEYIQFKLSSNTKLVNANKLLSGIEDKSLDEEM